MRPTLRSCPSGAVEPSARLTDARCDPRGELGDRGVVEGCSGQLEEAGRGHLAVLVTGRRGPRVAVALAELNGGDKGDRRVAVLQRMVLDQVGAQDRGLDG